MTITVTMPALSPTMTEGKLAKWHRKEGDRISSGDVIAEIETDKATMEFEAADEGILGKILVEAGTEGVAVNTPIAILLEEGESKDNIEKSPSPQPPLKREREPEKPLSQGEREVPAKREGEGTRMFISPLARRIAEEKGIDLSHVRGSGPRGRIVKADIDTAKPVSFPSAASPKPSPSGPSARQLADAYGMEYEEIPNSNMRKVIASRLLESKLTIPHFYLTIECRIDELLKARQRINDEAKGEYKLSVNDFIVKAVAQSLKVYPKANVAWTDDAILQFRHADISVAVATKEGLVTPIVKKAETKGLREISAEVKQLAEKAREGKLRPEEFQGGTITVSNLGMYGIDEFAAIINPPQACIVSIGAGQEKTFVENGEIKVGTFMKCTLSCDHRCVDGAVGAEYLNVFRRFIENPVSMLV